jgi:beta-D-xylosidase 4
MDTICEVPGFNNGSNVAGSYEANLLPEKAVDKALSRLYEGLVRAGYFDPASSSPYRNLAWSDVNTPEAQALAVKSATDGIVLKKNDGTLPIAFEGKNVAIIGHWGNASRTMLGPYSGVPPYYHSPVYAAEKLGLKVNYASGPVNQSASDKDTWTADALAAAKASDIILYFGGTDMSVESEDLDRYSIALPGAQAALIEQLGKMDKPLIIAQLGDQTDDTPLLKNENVNAILWAGFPGQSGGTAIFSVLTGKTAPAGRLPVTQYPASYVGEVSLLDMTLRPSGISPGRTYRWYNKPVLPFGHGLHYTTFNASLDSKSLAKTYDMAKLKKDCDAKYPDLCELGSINIGVENTGNVTSDYVALVFVSGEYGPKPYPLKSLVGYSRLRGMAAGKATTASIRVTLGDLARVDGIGNTVLYPGTYKVQVGVPAEDDAVFVIEGDAWVLDKFPQPPRQ